MSPGFCVSLYKLHWRLRRRAAVIQLLMHVCTCIVDWCVHKLSWVTSVVSANAQIFFPAFSPRQSERNLLWQTDNGRGSETWWEGLKRKGQLSEKSTTCRSVGTRLHCVAFWKQLVKYCETLTLEFRVNKHLIDQFKLWP